VFTRPRNHRPGPGKDRFRTTEKPRSAGVSVAVRPPIGEANTTQFCEGIGTMETLCLVLSEDHPLIQVGFRGTIRLGPGLEVQISGALEKPDRQRTLPPHKRKALAMIVDGCQTIEVAERLGLCLERAEALHDELVSKFGLDRITRQIHAAIRTGALGIIREDVRNGKQRAACTTTVQDKTVGGGRLMADQNLVRTLFPDALARCQDGGEWVIVPDSGDLHQLGRGQSESEAWSAAAIRLCEDEWFRPILSQLVAMNTRRGSNGRM
jgi:hypothetical protein